MDRVQAEKALRDAVGAHISSQLTIDDLRRALDAARTPDAQGRTPSDPDYVETIDPHWAAAEAVTGLAIRAAGEPSLSKVTVEGASFERSAPDLWRLAALLRLRSPLGQQLAKAQAELGVIEIDNSVGYIPRSHAEIGRYRDGLTNR